jgi:hypothetical protein
VKRWPKPVTDSCLPSLFPLDIAAETGGPLKTYFAAIKAQSEFSYTLPGEFVGSKSSAGTDILSLHIKTEIEASLFRDTPLEFILLGEPNHATLSWLQECCFDRQFETQVAHAPTLLSWAKTFFPETCQRLSELEMARHLGAYRADFEEVESRPWSGFRFFPGFLRKRGVTEAAETAAKENATREALFSPQDEEHEARALGDGELCLNPTMQLVRNESTVTAYSRWDRELFSTDLVWSEALVVDELQEEAKIHESRLLRKLQMPEAPGVVLKLIKEKIVLRGS